MRRSRWSYSIPAAVAGNRASARLRSATEPVMRFPAERLLKSAVIVVAVVLLAAGSSADSRITVPEPGGLWTGPMRGHTPGTLKGAAVIDLAALDALLADRPVLLDVAASEKKPADFPQDMPWLPVHRSIPGAA